MDTTQLTSYFVHIILASMLVSRCALAGRRDLNHFNESPKRCCSVDQWEADMRLIGTTTRLRDPQHRMSGRMVYDYTNSRWAAEVTDTHNTQRNQRIVFDHNKNRKYAVTSEGCASVPLNQSSMYQYCVPNNATHHGYYETVVKKVSIGYDVWSYEVFLRPIRALMKMSAPRPLDGRCLPLQESAYTLIRNYWGWEEGEPACNPWREPDRAYSGDCFMSHYKRSLEPSGTRPAAFYANIDYRNMNTTIKSTEIFNIPENCVEHEEWPEHVTLNEFWGMIILRRKEDDRDLK